MNVSNSQIPLIEEDHQAAQQLARMIVQRNGEQPTHEEVQRLAEEHAQFGTRRFRLLHGLQQPVTRLEQLETERLHQTISKEEFLERFHQEANAELDSDLLQSFLNDLELRVVWYSRFFVTVSDRFSSQSEEALEQRAGRCRFELNRPYSLPDPMVHGIAELLEELRLAKGLDLVEQVDLSFTHSLDLFESLKFLLNDAWKTYLFLKQQKLKVFGEDSDMSVREFFHAHHRDDFPVAKKLQAVIRQDRALVRMYFKEQQMERNSVQDPIRDVIVNNQIHCDPHIEVNPSINVTVPQPESRTPEPPLPESELANDTKHADDSEKPLPSQTSTGQPPRLKNWALGYEHGKTWQWFQCRSGRWVDRKKIELPAGYGHALLLTMADQDGVIDKPNAYDTLKRQGHLGNDSKLKSAVIDALSNTRKKLKFQLAELSNCDRSQVPDPLPFESKSWRAAIQIGFAVLDDEGKLEFKLKSAM